MWKKNENEKGDVYGSASIQNTSAQTTLTPFETATAAATTQKAVIGPSISVKGEISGAEDLLIQGFVEGTINLKQNEVTIGKNGRVSANIYGRIVHVQGEVTGDCFGSEQVVVHKSGQVRGNITAPRVTLEDGARLKGAIDTNPGTTQDETKASKTNEKSNRTAGNSDAQRHVASASTPSGEARASMQ